MNALARYENRHQNMNRHNYGMPTIFDIFSRPLTDFETMFSQMPEDNIKLDVQADMPGVKKEDIKLDFDEGNLIIKAEHHTNKEKKDAEGYLIKERSSGVYQRTLHFIDADPKEINAAFAGGELDIRINKQKQEEKKTAITIH